MTDTPAISVLIPWCGRDEIEWTLAANTPAFRASHAEVLVLNCAGDADRLRHLICSSAATDVRQLDIAAPRFNKCLALNVGLSHARADVVFTLDADVVLLDNVLLELARAAGDGAFATVEWVYESMPGRPRPGLVGDHTVALVNHSSLEFVLKNGRRIQHPISRRDFLDNGRVGPGLLAVKKQDLLEIRGYNAELHGWGWEDDDVLVRLQAVLGRSRVQFGKVLHLSHGDDQRNVEGSRTQSGQFNFIKCCRNYNRGLFLGTYDADLARMSERVTENSAEPAAPGANTVDAVEQESPAPAIPGDCGRQDGVAGTAAQEDGRPVPTLAELLLHAALARLPLRERRILWVGRSRIDGLHQDTVPAGQRYRDDFRDSLPSPEYDVVVDSDIGSWTCCQRHWNTATRNYVRLLAPHGVLLTPQGGVGNPPPKEATVLTTAALRPLAWAVGLEVAGTGQGIHTLRVAAAPIGPERRVEQRNPLPG